MAKKDLLLLLARAKNYTYNIFGLELRSSKKSES